MTQMEVGTRLLIVGDDETDRRLYGGLLARQAPGAFDIEQSMAPRASRYRGSDNTTARCWTSACPTSPDWDSRPKRRTAANCRAPRCRSPAMATKSSPSKR